MVKDRLVETTTYYKNIRNTGRVFRVSDYMTIRRFRLISVSTGEGL